MGSSVAKSRSSASTSLWVRTLSRVDLPAFVYPTSAHEASGTLVRAVRRVRRWRSITTRRSRRRLSCWRMRRRSTSICFSPGPPRSPTPPRWRSRWDQPPARRGRRCSSCAISTCTRPSAVIARRAKMARITSVRSSTGTPHSSWRLRCWRGVSWSLQSTAGHVQLGEMGRERGHDAGAEEGRRVRLAQRDQAPLEHLGAERAGQFLELVELDVALLALVASGDGADDDDPLQFCADRGISSGRRVEMGQLARHRSGRNLEHAISLPTAPAVCSMVRSPHAQPVWRRRPGSSAGGRALPATVSPAAHSTRTWSTPRATGPARAEPMGTPEKFSAIDTAKARPNHARAVRRWRSEKARTLDARIRATGDRDARRRSAPAKARAAPGSRDPSTRTEQRHRTRARVPPSECGRR